MIKSFRFNKVILLVACLFMITSIALAQQMTVTGIISDSGSGDVLPGVTVVIKGTTTGTISTPDGSYTITANKGDVLMYSFIGYITKEVTVADATKINVQLEPDVIGVDEVVVIGYGTVKKEDATGSVIAVGADDFNQGAISTPQDLLVGKTSGIQITSGGGQPGASSTIRIRGGASLTASNDPLIVIDGVPISSDGVMGLSNPLSSINPDDIETFTVLKDASATAIYGSRASNGVIIITTKTGSKGQPLKVTYSGKFSLGMIRDKIDVYEADEYRTLINELYGPDSENPNPDAIAAMGDANTNWQDEIYESAFGQEHNLSLQGGLDFLPYRFSYGYNNQDGVLKTSNLERHSVSLNLTPTFLDNHLKTTLNLKGSYVKNQFADAGAVGAAISMDPTHPVRTTYDYPNGEQWGGYWQWIDPTTGLPLSFTTSNPVALLEQRDDKSDVYRAIVNFTADYKFHFLPELRAVVNLGLDYSDSEQNRLISKDATWEYASEDIRGIDFNEEQEKTNQVLDMYLNYKRTFGEHSVDGMAGYSWQYFKNEGNIYENDVDDMRDTPLQESIYGGENYLISYYGRVNYSFRDKYLFTGTVRRDGTSRFADGNRWGTFPSIALGWKIKEESFLKSVDFVNDMKLRLGWGITGQQDVTGNDYVGYGTYTLSNDGARYIFGNRWINTYRPDAYNPDLKWEETESYNVGIDFAFMNSRISGSIDYYYKETTDLINELTVAAGTSLSDRVVSNVGSLENQGLELNLVGRIISQQNLYWEIGGNMTYNKNEITKLTAVDDPNYDGIPTGDLGSGRNIKMNSVGKPTNMFYVYEQVYGDDGRPLEGVYVDQNGDGVINDSDKIYYGSSTPDVLIGLNTSLKYKNWDFNLSGRFQLGGQIYNSVAEGGANYVNMYHPSTRALSNKLTAASTTNFLNTDDQRDFSSHWVEDADFFRLDNVSVGYNFKSVFGLEGSKLRLSLTGQNLFIISDYSGLDPEVFDGIDNNIFPRPTTVMFGVNFGF